MFLVLLKFTDRRDRAADLMGGHNAWLKQGFDEGVFVLAGGLPPGLGGAVIAHGVSRATIETRVAADPFVAEGVVTAEIIEIAPGKTDDRLAFLKGDTPTLP